MKNIIFAIMLMVCAGVASAKPILISIVWPFSVGDTQAQYSRSLVEELNKIQDKYQFIFENKPGAGAAIAARHVASTPNTILSASTAFFVRPNFYPNESHTISEFRPLMTQCAAPMVLVSKKYSSWNEIPKDAKINIGISGLGATSHLMALEIKKIYKNATPVPYKGTREASLDAIAGHVDLAVAFIGEVEQYIEEKKLYGLGVTGNNTIKNIRPLETYGFSGVGEIINMHSLIVPKTMPQDQYAELRNFVVEAAKSPAVQKAYTSDYCQPSFLDLPKTQLWFSKQIEFWRRLSQDVKLDK
jgi:tripartite-type tricarboxylate transporter receptor subunit TctC